MIIKTKHNTIIYTFFKGFSRWTIKRHFKPVTITGEIEDRNLPVLLIANHVSWWDGFWAMYLNLQVFQRKFHFMMLEKQLRKYWYFRYSGGFSVNKKSKGALESIQHAVELLQNSQNLVLVFPQGKIHSVYERSFVFEKGLERILQGCTNPVQLVFAANLIDYFSNAKPGLYLYVYEYSNPSKKLEDVQKEYNAFYQQCLDKQKNLISKE